MASLTTTVWNLVTNLWKKWNQCEPKSKAINVTIALSTVVVSRWLYNNRAKKHATVPSYPNWTPYLGHMPWLLKMGRDKILDGMTDSLISMGETKAISFSRAFFWTSVQLTDPYLIDYCFNQQFEKFEKGEMINEMMYELLGNGIFASDPPQWKIHRKIASTMFSMRNLKNFMFETACDSSHKFLCKMDEMSQTTRDNLQTQNKFGDGIIDIYNLFACYTLDTFVTIAFGQSLGIIDKLPNIHPFMQAFDSTIDNIGLRFRYPFYKIRRYFNIGIEAKIKESMQIINRFCDLMIDDLRKSEMMITGNSNKTRMTSNNTSDGDMPRVEEFRRQLTDESGKNKHNLLSLFLRHDPNISKKELIDVALNMILAGRDTTRLLLTWFLYELTNYPQFEEKIVNEINEFDKKYDKLTYENIQNFVKKGDKKSVIGNNFEFLECCLLESLRLHSVVPFLMRYAKERVDLPGTDGYFVDKGQAVIVNNYANARLPWIWGENAKEFDPTRFAKNGVNTYSAEKYPMFNINPRMCLGKHVALMEAKIVAIDFLRKYKYQIVNKDEVAYVFAPTLNMKVGMKIRVFPRE